MSEMPEGWVSGAIRDLYEINPGHKGLEITEDLPVSFVPMPSIEECTGRLDATHVRPYREVRNGFTRFVEGDVVFAKITPCMENGKVALAEGLSNGIGAGTTELHVFRPMVPDANRYLLYFLLQESVREEARKNFQGTSGHLRVPSSFFDEVQFPIPPIAEQRRIVAKLETLLGKVDDCRKRLDKIPVLLKRFRQSVLAAACVGRLTADWRELHLMASASPSVGQPVEYLPPTWRACRIGDIGKVNNGSTPSRKSPEFWNGGIPWVSSGEVRNNIISATRETISKEGFENSSVKRLPRGTILLAMIGEGKTRGQSAILTIEATINQNIAAIVPAPSLISSEYLWYWFRGQYEATRESGSGSGPQALNCQRVRELPLNLAPLSEQHEIVQRVNALFAVADQIEVRYAKAEAYVDQLRPSILSKAFRGELVPQDSKDEPASVLLDRIREQRTSAVAAPSSRKPRSSITAPKTIKSATGRARRGRSPKADSRVPELPASVDDRIESPLSITARKILKRMKPGRDYARADLVGPLALSPARWTAAIRELREGGYVLQEGDRRGARYRLTNG